MRQTLFRQAGLTALLLTTLTAPLSAQEGFTNEDAKQWRGIARLKKLTAQGKRYKMEAEYPVFLARTRLNGFANTFLRRYATGDFYKFLDTTKKELKDLNPEIPGYDFESGPYLSTYKPGKVISLTMNTYRYMGGAHGLGLTDGIVFAMVNGKPKDVVLGDLFRPGSNYRKRIESLILAKLKQDKNADWIQDGSVKTLSPGQLNNFTVEKTGLEWTFNPYEVGPYAAGVFTVNLSWAELGPDFKRSLVN